MAVTGSVAGGSAPSGTVLKSPGLLKKHYSPRARVAIWDWHDDAALLAKLSATGVQAKRAHVIAHQRIPSSARFGRVSVIPHDPEAYARAIYAELHASDARHPDLIIIEALPPGPDWHAIADRLERAAATGETGVRRARPAVRRAPGEKVTLWVVTGLTK